MRAPQKSPKKSSFFSFLAILTAFFLANPSLVSPLSAQSVSRPPISPVQLEKLLRVIDRRGENVRFNDQITEALGLGEGVIVRQATATDPVTRQAYFFAAVPATGQYLVGTRDQFGGEIFLINSELRLVSGVAARDKIQKLSVPEAGKKLQDILTKFEAFLEMN